MGRGSSGGSHHSSGGHSSSSSHSSGGRMSSSGRGSYSSLRGSYRSSNRGPYSGGFYNPRPYHRGGYYGSARRNYIPTSIGTLITLIILIVMILVIPLANSASLSITKSTVERTKLDASATISTEFYVDELNWIRNSTTLNNGLKSFYNETGVHPLLYITDTVNGTKSPSEDDMATYASELYTELCPDEGHILLLFHCLDGGTNYSMWYECGSQAKIVMDEEACNILLDYIDAYFYSDRTDDELFADAFKDAGKRIMTKTTSPIVYVAICAAVVILAIISFIWRKKRKEQKNIEDENTIKILNSDISQVHNDPEMDELERKYEDS
ncbi:MAG: hypothetical protein LUF26_06060 [Firmicutes bacterium]|nr:hypothetical protein [Bacillota bacterium]